VQGTCNRVQIIHQGQLVFADSMAGLEQRLQATSLVAAFHATPDCDALGQLPGVSSIEILDGNRMRLHYAGTDPSEALVELAVSRQWRLHELTPDRRTLEQIFIELTCAEPPATESGEAA
jgi:ABC-2 type transport system ATP-binding protein